MREPKWELGAVHCPECGVQVIDLEPIIEPRRVIPGGWVVTYKDMDTVTGFTIQPCGHFAATVERDIEKGVRIS